MSYVSTYLLRLTIFALVTVLSAGAALPASAGCLQEWADCGACAKRHMRQAVWNLNPWGIADAFTEALDCDIDLLHCVLMARGHEYSCG